jgi:hypothetical protein
MNSFQKIGLVFTTIFTFNFVIAQTTINPYYFDGDNVVFVFDVRNYAKALKGDHADQVDFADLGIYEVAISGKFNNWSKKGWRMEKKSEFTYELKKHIQDFNDAFPIEFRYIVNGKYIADPNGKISDSRQFSDDFLKDVYKLDLSVLNCTDQGNTRFYLPGFQQAKEVILAGSFNGWDEHTTLMQKTMDGWELKADLPPGRYEYKFIVDGQWMHDPLNRENVRNEHGTLNSVLNITVPITFQLKGFTQAKTVILTGSFVNWNEHKIKMSLYGDTWKTTLPLTGGKFEYKYIVDGQWMTDPANPVIEDDGKGNQNSILFVH